MTDTPWPTQTEALASVFRVDPADLDLSPATPLPAEDSMTDPTCTAPSLPPEAAQP
jgi:hypothetical protein